MSGVLAVDTALLRRAGGRLADLAQVFGAANVTARELRGAIGHDGLADEIGGFAIGWDDIRVGFVKDIGFLGEACERIGATFEEIDTEFASQLRGLV